MEHEETLLRQRIITADTELKKSGADKRTSAVIDQGICILEKGQTFGEEAILFPNSKSNYTVTVVSDTAELWIINELEMSKLCKKVPNTKVELVKLMLMKAK